MKARESFVRRRSLNKAGLYFVMPAKAGIQAYSKFLDSRSRGLGRE